MSVSLIQNPMYRLGRKAARKIHIEDRYEKAMKLLWEYNTKRKTCIPGDLLLELSDSVFIPILQNTNQLAFGYKVDNRIEYYLRRYLKANDLWGFVKNVLGKEGYTDADAVNTNNSAVLGVVFGGSYGVCPTTGGSCAGNAAMTCVNLYYINHQALCCTSTWISVGGQTFVGVDTAPYYTSYTTGGFGVVYGFGSSNTVTLSGSVTIPSCFPSSGIAIQLDLVTNQSSGGTNVTCASSCPSGSICGSGTFNYCPGRTYTSGYIPILYYNLNYSVLPNTTYSFWLQFSVS